MADGPAQHAAADGEMHLHVIGLQQGLGIVRQRCRPALRHRIEQHARVGVERCREHLGDAAGLDDHAVLHHAYLIGIAADDLQVVGDQQQRHPPFRPEPRQQLQDLRLDGDVKAVVGSSAISNAGSLASAIAIMTR